MSLEMVGVFYLTLLLAMPLIILYVLILGLAAHQSARCLPRERSLLAVVDLPQRHGQVAERGGAITHEG
jgi:hypothetical protein